MTNRGFGSRSLYLVAAAVLLLATVWLLAGCGKSGQTTEIEGNLGEVSVPDDGCSYELWLVPQGGRNYAKYLAEPAAEVPPGNYELVQYYARSPKDSKCWVTGSPKRMQFTVTAGATTELNIGGTYTAQAAAQTYGSDVSIDLTMTDSGGNPVSIEGGSPPRFRIVSSSGDTLQEGSFEYG